MYVHVNFQTQFISKKSVFVDGFAEQKPTVMGVTK